MKVILNFMGILREYTGDHQISLELPDEAHFGDLLNEIQKRYGNRLPGSLWDKEHQQFMPGILCVGEGRDFETKETLLKDGEKILFLMPMAGG